METATPPPEDWAAASLALRLSGTWRKRRDSVRRVLYPLAGPVRVPVPDFRPVHAYPPRWPGLSLRDDSDPPRYARRPGKLTPAQQATIRALAGTRSLRSLAADFGVSHETVRAVLSRRGTGA
ncbi:MAG: hypothetical protein AVDCRST_MAG49-3313 [uncultured Thermomicrobiales bacterium]|uniref:Uncharacterized protein n=1 Tax=uncultured Thermomicrobiales bacterium TaxID=1645740 RepID=A0A6J4V655_9BACT|nr:MAG: hypothetical protein AVDCRST_MAG49-3313 [uncultured Thermomicrobiales bacterium]